MAMMKCPDCGQPMQSGGTCKNCGYKDKGSSGKKPPFPPKKAPSKAPAKKGGKVPPGFAKKNSGY